MDKHPPVQDERAKDHGRPPLDLWYEQGDPGPEVLLTSTDARTVELKVQPPMTVCLPNLPSTATSTDCVLLQLNKEYIEVRQQVVRRDDDVLTKDQVEEHWAEVQTAMLKELMTWSNLKCMSQKKRSEAKNIIDARWVLKLKYATCTSIQT